MTIRNRLRLVFGLMLALMLALSGALVISLYLQNRFFSEYTEFNDRFVVSRELISLLERQRRHLDYFMALHESRERELFESLTADTVRSLGDYDRLASLRLGERYVGVLDAVGRACSERQYHRRLETMERQVFPELNDIIRRVSDGNAAAAAGMAAKRARINLLLQRTSIAAGAIILLSVFVTLGAIVGMYRGFTGPLEVFVRAASSIAEGEYHEISYPHRDEFREVVDTFNGMVRNLRQLQAQVIQMDRLSSVGQLTRGIAHELNNPLVGVLGQAQLLMERLPQDSPLRDHVSRIERAACRCKESVTKLLQFSRQHVYEYTAEDVNRVPLDALVMADSELKAHNVLVQHTLAGDLPRVRLSVPHMQQVFLNLINNAIQAMTSRSDGNRLEVRSFLTHVPPDAGGPLRYVTVELRDTGCGIPAENLVAIFEPMFTTKDRSRHAGVGLAIASDVVAHHRGKLLVKSEGIGKGATFVIHLPEDRPA